MFDSPDSFERNGEVRVSRVQLIGLNQTPDLTPVEELFKTPGITFTGGGRDNWTRFSHDMRGATLVTVIAEGKDAEIALGVFIQHTEERGICFQNPWYVGKSQS